VLYQSNINTNVNASEDEVKSHSSVVKTTSSLELVSPEQYMFDVDCIILINFDINT
jgi:hypothetical protein